MTVFLTDVHALKLFLRIMLTFSFAGSLFILIDPEAYKKLNTILTKELGLKRRLIPAIEAEKESLEEFFVKNRKFFGSAFLILSFALLTLY